jgi:hypothetical protein
MIQIAFSLSDFQYTSLFMVNLIQSALLSCSGEVEKEQKEVLDKIKDMVKKYE